MQIEIRNLKQTADPTEMELNYIAIQSTDIL